MRCLVTGGAGFIGGHLARRLLALGHSVEILDDFSSSSDSDAPEVDDILVIDIGTSTHELRQALAMGGYDVVFHCAAVSRTPPAVKDPVRCMQVNVMGTQHLLEAIRLHNPKCRFIFSSSNIVYAGPTAYRASKLAAEDICQVYSQLYGLKTLSLRYSNVYGPFIKKGDCAVFASLRDSALANGYIEITGDGSQTRDFTHVDDIVEANLLAWQHLTRLQGSSGYGLAPIDICTGINTSLADIAEYFKNKHGIECRYVGDRVGDVKHIVQSPARAEEILGWKATIPLEIGIGSIWHRER